MTEVSGGTHIAPDDGPDRPESVGPALPGVECRIVDPGTGADLRPGEPGELLVRTPGAMRGYLGDPGATAATIDPDGVPDGAALGLRMVEAGLTTAPDDTWSDRLSKILVHRVEPHLGTPRPTILDRYPAAEAALARRNPSDPRVA